jgi:hypothetical protein
VFTSNKRKIIKSSFLVAAFLLTGCAGPKYIGADIDSSIVDTSKKIIIINHKKTRAGFQNAMETWLNDNDKKFEALPASTVRDTNFLTLEYIGRWSWDLGLFLSDAEIKAYRDGQQVGAVQFLAPNTFNTSKYGDAKERVGYMMDVLFGFETPESATVNVN